MSAPSSAIAEADQGPLAQALWRSIQGSGDAQVAAAWGAASAGPAIEVHAAPLPSAGWAGMALLALFALYRSRHRHAAGTPVRHPT